MTQTKRDIPVFQVGGWEWGFEPTSYKTLLSRNLKL